jgi:hypothetical protein
MSFHLILRNHEGQIISAAQNAISIGVIDAWNRSKKPQEPDFIASLVVNSVPYWATFLNSMLSLYSISVSVLSVFCHQTPKVRFVKNPSIRPCEVGDVLFVHFHRDNSGFIYRNALLYQAKMGSAQPHRIPSREHHQLELYKKWPEVEYVSSGSLSGQKRDIKPKMPHLGAQYLLIDDRGPKHPLGGVIPYPGTFPFGSCIADDFLVIRNDLAVELFQFLSLGSGKPFLDQAESTSDGWTALVWDLLNAGIKKAFNRKRAGFSNEPRVSGWNLARMDGISLVSAPKLASRSIAFQVLGSERATILFSGSSDGNDGTFDRDDDALFADDNAGTSIVLIETDETGEG